MPARLEWVRTKRMTRCVVWSQSNMSQQSPSEFHIGKFFLNLRIAALSSGWQSSADEAIGDKRKRRSGNMSIGVA